jgi:hypothetical protein
LLTFFSTCAFWDVGDNDNFRPTAGQRHRFERNGLDAVGYFEQPS